MKSQSIKSKVAKYSALASTLLAGGAIDAQIVYTDVSPDVVLDTLDPAYPVDLNNDAIPDIFLLTDHVMGNGTFSGLPFSYIGNAAIVGFPSNQNGVVGASSSSSFLVSALNSGSPINATQTFSASSTENLAVDALVTIPGMGTYPMQQGNFLGASNKFLGVKFMVGTDAYYGWVQLSVSQNADEITIYDYAYNSSAGGPINAGQMNSSGIENATLEQSVTIVPTLENVVINVTPNLFGGEIQISSLDGRVVANEKIKDVNTSISLQGIPSGIYSVSAHFDQGIISKRIYIK